MLCPNVEHNLSWRVDGSLSPCNNIINFPAFYRLEEMQSSNEYKQLISDNCNGVKSIYCTRCWDKEYLGLKSKRQQDQHLDTVLRKINSHYLKIDSALGSTCNAACVICGPGSSSLWQKYIPIDKQTQKSQIWNITYQNLEQIVQLDFGGGEPWLNEVDKQEELFDKLIQTGLSKKIKIRYNTNGSLYPKKLLEKLRHFRQVEITLSIDDIEDRFEYNRWPLKWHTVLSNIEKLKQLSKDSSNILLTINFTVSVFTWLRAEQFTKWAEQFGINKVNFNILTSPKIYSIKSLPVDKINSKTPFDDIIGTDLINDWSDKFQEHVDLLDQKRKTEWRKIFPELRILI